MVVFFALDPDSPSVFFIITTVARSAHLHRDILPCSSLRPFLA